VKNSASEGRLEANRLQYSAKGFCRVANESEARALTFESKLSELNATRRPHRRDGSVQF